MAIDPVTTIALSLLLSYVLVDAALHKLRNPLHYAVIIDEYRVAPRGAGRLLVWPVCSAELLAGLALLLPPLHRAGLLLAALLLAAYFALIALNLLRGRREIDCGCGAPERAQGLSAALLARNALLVVLALAMLLAAPLSRSFVWLDWLVVAGAALALILVYLSLNLLVSNQQLLAKLK